VRYIEVRKAAQGHTAPEYHLSLKHRFQKSAGESAGKGHWCHLTNEARGLLY
jgi:hypothetical protein